MGFAPKTRIRTGLAAGGSRIRTLGPPWGKNSKYEISRQDRGITSRPDRGVRGLVRPVHQLPGRSARLRNLTAGDLRRAARDLCRRASRAAFRARSPVCSARAGAARAGDSLNARPPRAVAKPRATSGGRFCEVSLRARTKGRAKSWTLRSVADAKWSTTGNFQVASCLWTPSCFVDDILDLGSTFNTFKKFSGKES
jgi:hypothetical protein